MISSSRTHLLLLSLVCDPITSCRTRWNAIMNTSLWDSSLVASGEIDIILLLFSLDRSHTWLHPQAEVPLLNNHEWRHFLTLPISNASAMNAFRRLSSFDEWVTMNITVLLSSLHLPYLMNGSSLANPNARWQIIWDASRCVHLIELDHERLVWSVLLYSIGDAEEIRRIFLIRLYSIVNGS